ncbi:fumarylacetoacetate hydrolase family protein [Ideonella sp. DXS29W]|uniref:Fumarylacetoacetate hydrolase family protein n=1 Tax=Ideonella lacteola TaxID=2984193 RepID=A0ABU9BKU2_9BURK
MKLATYQVHGSTEIGALLPDGQRLARLQAAAQVFEGRQSPWFTDMLAFLRGDVAARNAAQRLLEKFDRDPRPECGVALADVCLLAPVPVPESIREFMNFEQHVINCARKFGMPRWRQRIDRFIERHVGRQHTLAYRSSLPWYERPVYYKGNRFSVVGPEAQVQIPHYSQVFDYELEFGIFLSRGGRNIPRDQAHQHIGGYVIFNDFSARDIQSREMGGRLGPAKGKDFDTGNAMGPWLVTPDEVPDPYNLLMQARINGERVSVGRSSDMRFRFDDVLHYVSQAETLYPGEFFGSGTCSGADGVGCGVEHGRFLRAGDVIELEVEGLGVLRNRVVPAAADSRAAPILRPLQPAQVGAR